jgi:hypothetical protein
MQKGRDVKTEAQASGVMWPQAEEATKSEKRQNTDSVLKS